MNFYNFDYINEGLNYIHKTAIIGENVEMGKGNIVMPFTVIGFPGSIRGIDEFKGRIIIGDNNKIHSNVAIMVGESGTTYIGNDNVIQNFVNVGHNCMIGDKNEIGVGTILCGNVNIGSKNQIKVNVSIRNRVTIGSGNIIGMGSNVIHSIENDIKVYGNPAKKI